MVFNGQFNESIFKEYARWLPFITDLFLPSIDSETGSFLHLPFEGGIMEQPCITMNIMKLLQGNYRKVQGEKMKLSMKRKK